MCSVFQKRLLKEESPKVKSMDTGKRENYFLLTFRSKDASGMERSGFPDATSIHKGNNTLGKCMCQERGHNSVEFLVLSV